MNDTLTAEKPRTKEPKDLGFADSFEDENPDQWTLPKETVSNDPEIPPEEIKRVAEETNFSSREPAPAKERMDQINFRAKENTIQDFKRFCRAQEPPWPFGHGFEKAIAALKREMQR